VTSWPFRDRVKTILETSAYGFAYDEIAAAMEAGWAGSLTDLVDRITALKRMRDEANFLSILDSRKKKRAHRQITAGHDSSAVNPSKLEHDAREAPNELATVVSAQIGRHDRGARLQQRPAVVRGHGRQLETSSRSVVMVEDESYARTACRFSGRWARRRPHRRCDEDRRRSTRVPGVTFRPSRSASPLRCC